MLQDKVLHVVNWSARGCGMCCCYEFGVDGGYGCWLPIGSSLQCDDREHGDYLCSIGMRPLTKLLPLHCNVLKCLCRPEGALN